MLNPRQSLRRAGICTRIACASIEGSNRLLDGTATFRLSAVHRPAGGPGGRYHGESHETPGRRSAPFCLNPFLPGPGLRLCELHEIRVPVPMRDEVKLFTSVYVHKDDSQAFPILDHYRPTLGPSEKFAREAFIFVYQDVRGRYMSEATGVEARPHKRVKNGPQHTDESTDTYETIDWLVKNIRNNNDKVGMWGISYPGFYVAAGMIDADPALKAASLQAPIGDDYMGDDSFHNGAFMLAANLGRSSSEREVRLPGQFQRFKYGTPDGYDFLSTYGSAVTGQREVLQSRKPVLEPAHGADGIQRLLEVAGDCSERQRIKPAVMTVGGWFDAEDLAGP